MELWQATLLGLVQGLTEFLPVSSSGHLRVVQHFTGLEEPQTLFDVIVHAGTLLAVMVMFRRDLLEMLTSPFRLPRRIRESGWRGPFLDPGFRVGLLIVFGSIPTGLIGYYLGPRFEHLAMALEFVAFMFIINGVLLLLSNKVVLPVASRNRLNTGYLGVRFFDALLIGVAQGFAVLRGISRSGTTISCALMLGVDRDTAGRFSFLLSIPAIVGAVALSLKDVGQQQVQLDVLLLGGAVAFVSGYLALRILMTLVRKGSFHHFGWYTLLLGGTLLIWLHFGPFDLLT